MVRSKKAAAASPSPPLPKNPAGYSGRPLPVKLGFKPGMVAAFVALPPELIALTESVAFAAVVRTDAWHARLNGGPFDVIHAFTNSHAEIAAGLPRLENAIRRNGMIWVSWPKKASRLASDVTEDVVRAEALRGDLVDVKVAAIDAVRAGPSLRLAGLPQADAGKEERHRPSAPVPQATCATVTDA